MNHDDQKKLETLIEATADDIDYRSRVSAWSAGKHSVSSGPCPGCPDCGLEGVSDMDDPRYEDAANSSGSFSWRACDVCRRGLGGAREPMHWREVDDEGLIVHGDACPDCVYYLEYGRRDDQTLIELESV